MSTEKYPRTPHFPFSPGATSDDRMLKSFEHLVGVPLVITEKMDGSNAAMSREHLYARSHSGAPHHPAFDMAKVIHGQTHYRIPAGVSVFGEYVYARHSIPYSSLPGYFLVFGVREDDANIWWAWDMVTLMAHELELPTVPELWRGITHSEDELARKVLLESRRPSWYGPQREGVVVRTLDGFPAEDFVSHIAKWVRAGHVQTGEHWMHQKIVPNTLSTSR